MLIAESPDFRRGEYVKEINMIAGCAPMPKKSLEFIVDRPFIFVIRDVPSGIDLFAGAVNEIVN